MLEPLATQNNLQICITMHAMGAFMRICARSAKTSRGTVRALACRAPPVQVSLSFLCADSPLSIENCALKCYKNQCIIYKMVQSRTLS